MRQDEKIEGKAYLCHMPNTYPEYMICIFWKGKFNWNGMILTPDAWMIAGEELDNLLKIA